MTKIEALINDRLGKDWLNYGQAKDIGFGPDPRGCRYTAARSACVRLRHK